MEQVGREEAPIAIAIGSKGGGLVCRVCQKQFSRYTCPRCNLRHCSLPCYKSHSVHCVESFARDSVLAHLRGDGDSNGDGASADSKKRMMEILQRFHLRDGKDPQHWNSDEDGDGEGYDDDDDDDNDAAAKCSVLSDGTLEKIAQGQHVKFDDLTASEKKAFQRAAASGELSHMFKPWDPWWLSISAKSISLSRDGNRLIQPMDEKGGGSIDYFGVPSPPESPLPPLERLTRSSPSPLLGLHLVEITYSYCFTLRFYNGDWQSDSLDAASTCLSVSQVLGQVATPESVADALCGCLEVVCSPAFKSTGGYKFGLALLDDTATLLHLGKPGLICMLADLHRLLQAAIKELASVGKMSLTLGVLGGKLAGKKKLLAASQKLYFLMCWAHEQQNSVFDSLALLVEGEKAILGDSQTQNSEEKRGKIKKPFIEEI